MKLKNIKFLKELPYKNVKELLYGSKELFGNKSAFKIKHKDEKGNVSYEIKTYSDLLEDVNNFGAGLYKLGYKGKRIAVVGKNSYEWVVAHLANLLGGIISIPLDKELQVGELENSLVRSEANAIVFDNKLSETMKEIKDSGKTKIKDFISVKEEDGFESFEAIKELGKKELDNGNTEYIDNKIDNDALAILLFTSGTTSNSKAVMLTQANVVINACDLMKVEPFSEKDVNIAFLPFHHIFGSTCMLMMLGFGVETVFPDGLRYIKQNLAEYKVSAFVGVPVLTEAIYKAILKEVEKTKQTKKVKMAIKISNFLLKFGIDIRRKLVKKIIGALGGELRTIVSGGAPADKESIKGFNDFGILTLVGYGLSETGPVVCAENYKYRRLGSVGMPMPSVEVDIINKDENGIGEIITRGPSVMLGYYQMEELTNEVLVDGWFHTGDLGYFDKDGYLFITGRNKNLIVLKNGKKVFPEELETMVNKIDLVSESMVYSIPDKEDENDVKVCVKVVYDAEVIKEKYADKSEDELKDLVWEKIKEVNTTFPKYKHIKGLIVSHEELIKTTTKKVKRQEEMKKILEEID